MPAVVGLVPRIAILGAMLLIGLVSLTGRVSGQGLVPELLAIQGYMEDGSGAPLGPSSPVNYPVVFRIFGAPTGGTATWSERQTVTFDKGNYSVLLGQGAVNGAEPRPNLSAVVINASGSLLFVESTVTINGTDAKILPRLQLLPTPYAFLSSKALSMDAAGIISGTIADDRLTPALRYYITNGPVADSQLSASLLNTINNGAIADNRLSAGLRSYITNGPVADSQLSASLINTINNGAIADARLSANVARRNTANSFTGDQTINGSQTVNGNATVNGNLNVANNLSVGNLGQYQVAASAESLRIVRGTVRIDGTSITDPNRRPVVLSGANFSVAKMTTNPIGTVNAGGYNFDTICEIIFSPPFADAPVLTVSALGDRFSTGGFNWWNNVRVESTTRSNAVVSCWHPANGGWLVLAPFSFIAVGQR